MSGRAVPPREAASALFLLLLLWAAFFLTDPSPGGGPLALCLALAAFHAALIAPALSGAGAWAWGFLPLVLALPALASALYGHGGWGTFLQSFLLVGMACAAGASSRRLSALRRGRLYLPLTLLLFLAPFGLSYLVAEFGSGDAASWRLLSPLGGAIALGSGESLSALSVLPLLAWPVWTVAQRES
ncbi:MAG: hypothetical protein O7E54_02875 [Planctomycetota bacterium]|jgi:hypothetical protein|nr:hypothetical protein [Planctomycetota bacterium]